MATKEKNDTPIAAGKSSFELVDNALVFKELEIKGKRTFLDIACGVGRYSIAAAEIMGKDSMIYGIDLWEEGIVAIKKEIEAKGINNITAIAANVSEHIPVDDHSIDVCLMATVLHDLKLDGTDAGTLKETARVMKHGGTLGIVEFTKIDRKPGPPIHIRLTPDEVEKLVAPYGFMLKKTVEVGPQNYLSIYIAA